MRQHRAAARPPPKPGIRPIGQRTRNADTTQWTVRPCAAGRLRVADATSTVATCNAHRCNMQHATRADATRKHAPMQRATRADALCNMLHAPVHRVTRAGAARPDATCNMRRTPMQRATRTDATRIDATWRCNTQRAASLHAHRIPHGAFCTACTLAKRSRYMASAHSVPRMHASFRSEGLATRCMTSARASCGAHRARDAVQHSASRWGLPLRQRFERHTHTLHSGRMCRTPNTTRRSMRAPHRARELPAVPHRATYHTTARLDAQLALGARTALVFEIGPPLNVTAPSRMRTTPP
jgi:hypothetical protein